MAQSLKQNPFAVLGASTTDDMHRLAQLADEAQLFGDDGAEAAFAALTHTMHRLDAEVRWMPGAPDTAAQTILAYVRRKEPSAYPDLSDMPPLAQLNACRALLETWKIDDRESALALCRSLSVIWSGINAQEVMDLLNADRSAASLPLIVEVRDVYERLDGLCSEIVGDFHSRIEAAGVNLCEVMKDVAHCYEKSRGRLLEAMIHDYALTADGEKKRLEERIDTLCQQVLNAENMLVCSKMKNDILQAMDQWQQVTCPLRLLAQAKGKRDAQARSIYDKLYAAASHMNNQYRLHRDCAQILRRCDDMFFDLPEVKDHLRKNLAIAENARR